MSGNHHEHDRLEELLAGWQLDDLSPEERGELDLLLAEHGISTETPDVMGQLLLMLDEQDRLPDGSQEGMPEALAQRITAGGRGVIASRSPNSKSTLRLNPHTPQVNDDSGAVPTRSVLGWFAGIAALIAIGASIFAYSTISAKRQATSVYEAQVALLQELIDENQAIISGSRLAADRARAQIEQLDQALREQATELASSEQDNLDLAARLAEATTELRDATLKIAKYETPADPAVLAQRRQQLLEVPDSIQIAWQPFDLPDAPAEQRNVRGDVVWSDEMQQGYIRFVGLNLNDPNIEQYQVWVIDERGLEQKVSGGVFNASADGEVIVPIEPGIDVGRVALFAVTVENPGGTWVPDLSRRVVVAPRDS